MTYTSVFSERALNELTESWLWYEDQQEGLGERFTETILHNIQLIEKDPRKGLPRNRKYRESIVKGFPFLIIYRVDERDKVIFVHSIFNSNRNPKKKYRN